MNSAMWDSRHAAAPVWGDEPSGFVAATLQALPKGRALDLGAGDGRHALWLAGRGWRVTAVDTSAIAIGGLQALAATRALAIDAILADVTSYSPRRRSYDLVLLSYLQLPLVSLKLVLRRAATALADQGRLLLVAHDESNLDQGFGGPQDPDVLTSAGIVAAILQALGLEVTRAEVVRRDVRTEIGVRMALDHVVEAISLGERY